MRAAAEIHLGPQRLATYEARAESVREALESWAEVIVIAAITDLTRSPAILHRVARRTRPAQPRTSDEAPPRACVRTVKA
jgi:hypothetical protein